MSFTKRPLNSPETSLPDSKFVNLNSSSSDSEISFNLSHSSSFVSATSAQSCDRSNDTLTSNMASTANGDLTIGTAPDYIDLICTMVYEINGQPYLSPSLTDDDALSMLRQVN